MADDHTEPLASSAGIDPAVLGALAHLYRGEVSRSTHWRTRLDNTTNWAVLTTGIALSATFSDTNASPLPLVLVGSRHRAASWRSSPADLSLRVILTAIKASLALILVIDVIAVLSFARDTASSGWLSGDVLPLVLVGFLVTFFLVFEARRYRYYTNGPSR